ncbi:hypothetical protein [Marininema halotolerans]|nr:hypothetical protein [Marininema halotolerans]
MSATHNRTPGEPDPLDSVIGMFNASFIALLLWGLLYLLLRVW